MAQYQPAGKIRYEARPDGGVVYEASRRAGTLTRREDGQYLAEWGAATDGAEPGSGVYRDTQDAIDAIISARVAQREAALKKEHPHGPRKGR